MNLRKMLRTIRAFRAGAPLGDVVVLKLDALSPPPKPSLAQKLQALAGYSPEQKLPVLRALPAGTLGERYARFLDANGIEPLVVSAHVREQYRDNPYVLRYATTHDLHHVLTGFDAGLAGEVGVLAFTVGQGTSPVGRAMLWFTCFLYTIFSPTQALRIWHNARVGVAMGKRAKVVLAERIESSFAEPLGDVRARLDIVDPGEAGVVRSRFSIVGAIVYGRR